MSASFPRQKFHSPSQFPSPLILSFVFVHQAGQARSNIVICIDLAPTQKIDVTEKPKIPSKRA